MTEATDNAVLEALLSAYRLRARVTDHPSFCGHWREPEPMAPAGTAWFHLVDTGACRVEVPGLRQPLRLEAGDFLVLPRGTAHCLASDESAGDQTYMALLCGEFVFQDRPVNPLLNALPDAIVVRAAEGGPGFRRLAELLVSEARVGGFGSNAVMDRIADALFVMTLRHHLAQSTERLGLFAALADPRLKRALDALHAEPGRNWSVADMARAALLSRTAFAERFAETLGMGPYEYLTRWRMAEAARLLRDPHASVARVAERLGYRTEASFRRSFKRVQGHTPGELRRDAGP